MSIDFPFDVSRETLSRFDAYEQLVKKWNPVINLVSKNTVSDFSSRHLADSVQIYNKVNSWTTWLDMGSGGGLPGIVVGILAAQDKPDAQVHLIESDKRKSAFLFTCARELGLNVKIHSERIDDVANLGADVISARALSALDNLLGFAELHKNDNTTYLFPKGANWKQEVEDARKAWTFEFDALKSTTDPEAVILKIAGAQRV